MLLAGNKQKVFLHCIVTGDSEKRKSCGARAYALTSTTKLNIHVVWWDQIGYMYYELIKLNGIITGVLYQTQLMRLNRTRKNELTTFFKQNGEDLVYFSFICAYLWLALMTSWSANCKM